MSGIGVSNALTITDLTSRELASLECACNKAASPSMCKAKELRTLGKSRRITKLEKLNRYHRRALLQYCENSSCDGPVRFNHCLLEQLLEFQNSPSVRFRVDTLPDYIQSSLFSKCQHLTGRGLAAVGNCLQKEYTATQKPSKLLKETKDVRPTTESSSPPAVVDTAQLYKRLTPSVYMLVAWSNEKEGASGSAVAVTKSLALTTCHVLGKHPYSELRTKNHRIKISIDYRNDGSDVCILKDRSASLHPVIGVRVYDAIIIGERVYSVGSPDGLFNTFTEGLISGKRRVEGRQLLQFSAPITGGASGGGIFDKDGKLLGIIKSGLQDGNINFAIPIDKFKVEN